MAQKYEKYLRHTRLHSFSLAEGNYSITMIVAPNGRARPDPRSRALARDGVIEPDNTTIRDITRLINNPEGPFAGIVHLELDDELRRNPQGSFTIKFNSERQVMMRFAEAFLANSEDALDAGNTRGKLAAAVAEYKAREGANLPPAGEVTSPPPSADAAPSVGGAAPPLAMIAAVEPERNGTAPKPPTAVDLAGVEVTFRPGKTGEPAYVAVVDPKGKDSEEVSNILDMLYSGNKLRIESAGNVRDGKIEFGFAGRGGLEKFLDDVHAAKAITQILPGKNARSDAPAYTGVYEQKQKVALTEQGAAPATGGVKKAAFSDAPARDLSGQGNNWGEMARGEGGRRRVDKVDAFIGEVLGARKKGLEDSGGKYVKRGIAAAVAGCAIALATPLSVGVLIAAVSLTSGLGYAAIGSARNNNLPPSR